jgi:hypothetical protein
MPRNHGLSADRRSGRARKAALNAQEMPPAAIGQLGNSAKRAQRARITARPPSALKRCFTKRNGRAASTERRAIRIIPLGLSKNPASPAVLRIEDGTW